MTKQPQDYKPKAAPDPATVADIEDMTFEWDGKTYTITAESVAAVVTPGFFRKNRHESEMGMAFTLLELLEHDELLALLDDDWGAMQAIQGKLGTYSDRVLTVVLAESKKG